jgi:hypothetical protein
LATLAPERSVPLVLEARGATDTTGAEIPVAAVQPGQVHRPEPSGRGAFGTAVATATVDRPTVPPALAETAAVAALPRDGEGEAPTAGTTGSGFPIPLVAALVIAVVVGLGAVVLGDRSGADRASGPGER